VGELRGMREIRELRELGEMRDGGTFLNGKPCQPHFH
jgi:hypothetical protein